MVYFEISRVNILNPDGTLGHFLFGTISLKEYCENCEGACSLGEGVARAILYQSIPSINYFK